MGRRRRDFTESDKQKFLDGLERGLTVKDAALMAGREPRRMYELRARDPDFDQAVRLSMDIGTDVLVAEMQRRAIEGVQQPIIGKVAPGIDGQLTDADGNPMFLREYSDNIAIVMLKGRRAEYKDNPRIDLTHQTIVQVEDRSASLADVARVLREAGVDPDIIEGHAVEVGPELGEGRARAELPEPEPVLAEPGDVQRETSSVPAAS